MSSIPWAPHACTFQHRVMCCQHPLASDVTRVGQNHTSIVHRYIRCTYGILSREVTIHTVIYGVYIRFWPTLDMNCAAYSHTHSSGCTWGLTACLSSASFQRMLCRNAWVPFLSKFCSKCRKSCFCCACKVIKICKWMTWLHIDHYQSQIEAHAWPLFLTTIVPKQDSVMRGWCGGACVGNTLYCTADIFLLAWTQREAQSKHSKVSRIAAGCVSAISCITCTWANAACGRFYV
jgi:hypothetical protein